MTEDRTYRIGSVDFTKADFIDLVGTVHSRGWQGVVRIANALKLEATDTGLDRDATKEDWQQSIGGITSANHFLDIPEKVEEELDKDAEDAKK